MASKENKPMRVNTASKNSTRPAMMIPCESASAPYRPAMKRRKPSLNFCQKDMLTTSYIGYPINVNPI